MSSHNIPLSNLSSVPIELIDPELRDTLSSFILSILATADSVKDAHESIPTTILGYIESSVIQPHSDS